MKNELGRLVDVMGRAHGRDISMCAQDCLAQILQARQTATQRQTAIAIVPDELAVTRRQPVQLCNFAADRSPAVLDLARKGVYDAAAAQNVRLRHLRNDFAQQGETCIINPQLGKAIDFSS